MTVLTEVVICASLEYGFVSLTSFMKKTIIELESSRYCESVIDDDPSSKLHPQSTPQYFNHRHPCFLPRSLFRETHHTGTRLINADNQRPCG